MSRSPHPTARLRQLTDALWSYRRAGLLVGVGLLAGLLIATLTHQPAPRTGLPTRPDTVDAALDPGTGTDPGTPWPTAMATSSPDGRVQPGVLSIPEIGVRSAFVHLGLNRDGTLQAPTRYDEVGWYAGGPAPGDANGPPAVFAGHVDSKSGPGVFYRLNDLKVGEDFVIGGTDGTQRQFQIYRMATYGKNAFPAAQVYAASQRAEVRLITCTGTFDTESGHYESNLVVYAAMVGAVN